MEIICTIIVTYNRVHTLEQSLTRIMHQRFRPSRIVVVDNNSSDGTEEYVRKVQLHDHRVDYLRIDDNIGYAGGIARGMLYASKKCRYDYYWVMDDDTLYGTSALGQLVNAMRHADFGIVGLTGSNIRFGIKKPIPGDKLLQPADYVLIDGALIKGDVVQEIGVPYEKFFMMCEDHEYCKRIKREGYRIGILGNVENKRLYLGGAGKFTRSTLWRSYYQSRNHILILKEYFTLPDLLGFMFWHTKLMIAAAVFAPDRLKRLKMRMLGLWHGILGIAGKTLDPGTLKFYKHS